MCVHFEFDVKCYGRQKARLVADGHLTDAPISSVYSGVASLQGTIMVLFVAKLNMLDSWGTCIRNECLEAFDKEKAHMIASTDFGPLQGYALLINKALNGFRTF